MYVLPPYHIHSTITASSNILSVHWFSWRSQQAGCCSFCSTAIPTILVLISQKISLKTFLQHIKGGKKFRKLSSFRKAQERKKKEPVASIISKCDSFHDTLPSLKYEISMPLSVLHVTLTGLGAQESQMSMHCSRQTNCKGTRCVLRDAVHAKPEKRVIPSYIINTMGGLFATCQLGRLQPILLHAHQQLPCGFWQWPKFG